MCIIKIQKNARMLFCFHVPYTQTTQIINFTWLADDNPDANDEFFPSLPSSSRRPFPAGGTTVVMTWPALSTSTCLLPAASRFGVLLLNGRRLFGERTADCDNNWWTDGGVVDGNVARLKAVWNPETVLLIGLKWLATAAAETDVHEGWEVIKPVTVTAAVGTGFTAWLTASVVRGSTRTTCTGKWLETTAGCEITTSGDAGRLVETPLQTRGNTESYDIDELIDETTSLCDASVVTAVPIVFFLAISSSNYTTA